MTPNRIASPTFTTPTRIFMTPATPPLPPLPPPAHSVGAHAPAASDAASGPPAGPLRRLFGPLVDARTWRATAHLLADLPLGIAWFTVVVTGLSTGLGLAITFLGLPILLATILFGRVIGSIERRRAEILLDAALPAFPPIDRAGSWWAQAKRIATDRPGWRGLGYGVLLLPWGIATFTIAVTLWSLAVGLATYPVWAWALPDGPESGPFNFGSYVIEGTPQRVGVIAGTVVVGLVLLALTPRIVRGLAAVDCGLIRSLLSPDPTTVLNDRVEQLTISRDASLERASLDLQRIERDLHDGAQQRLVALAMDLGMARERLAAGQDPARAEELVARAHDEAKAAITELRELVRGIHPQILTDRGLDAALSALAARSPVPVTVDVRIDQRPPAAIEAAAYFVVAESLANLAKHSGASRATVRVERLGRMLIVDVRDDGRGGAVEVPGGGLAGLHDRVTAVEGVLRLTSPVGGPTEIHVELPCAS